MTKQLRVDWYKNLSAGPKTPTWLRRAAITADGVVFVPARIAGTESLIAFMAACDGVARFKDGGRIFVPAEWLAEQFPNVAAAVRHIAQDVQRLAAEAAAA
jgi:hypothetical protein